MRHQFLKDIVLAVTNLMNREVKMLPLETTCIKVLALKTSKPHSVLRFNEQVFLRIVKYLFNKTPTDGVRVARKYVRISKV